MYFIRCADPAARFFLYRRAQPDKARVPVRTCSQRMKQHGLIAHQLDEFFIKLRDGVGGIETKFFTRGIRAETVSVPDLAFRILLAAKQDGLCRAVVFLSGDKHQRGFRFDEAGQVIEIAVEAIGIMRIAVAQYLRCGGNDGDTALHLVQQCGAAFSVNRGIKQGCGHGVIVHPVGQDVGGYRHRPMPRDGVRR